MVIDQVIAFSGGGLLLKELLSTSLKHLQKIGCRGSKKLKCLIFTARQNSQGDSFSFSWVYPHSLKKFIY